MASTPAANKAAILVFDMHNEYGFDDNASDTGLRVIGLKSKFASKVRVIGLGAGANIRGSAPDFNLEIAERDISTADIEWAWAVIHRSIDSVAVGVARYMSGSASEALKKLVHGHITDAGKAGIAKSTLMRGRGVAKATPFELEGVISWLERSGQITNIGKTDAKNGRGRSGEKYVARDAFADAA